MPGYFSKMRWEMGTLAAFHTLIAKSEVSEGLTRLTLERRLDLSVEAIALLRPGDVDPPGHVGLPSPPGPYNPRRSHSAPRLPTVVLLGGRSIDIVGGSRKTPKLVV